MGENKCDFCSNDILNEYFLGTLDQSKKKELEEHFFECDICTGSIRNMNKAYSRQSIVKANPLLGVAFDRFGDAVEAKAAGDNNSGIRDFVTKNGKFRITLRPLEKSPNNALLEIEVIDKTINGRLKIRGTTSFNEVLDIDESNVACTIVNRSIELNRLIISKCD